MIMGTLAWVATGAIAIADGEKRKPARICTLSLVMSSVATIFACAPVGGPSSRLMISTLCGAMSFACSLMYRSKALSIWWPGSALGPLSVSTTPTLIVSARAAPPMATATAAKPRQRLIRMSNLPYLRHGQVGIPRSGGSGDPILWALTWTDSKASVNRERPIRDTARRPAGGQRPFVDVSCHIVQPDPDPHSGIVPEPVPEPVPGMRGRL